MYRLFKTLYVSSLCVFTFSCAIEVKQEEVSLDAEVSSDTTEEVVKVIEEEEQTIEKDPRLIGPEKGLEQRMIEDNLHKIRASDDPLYGFWVGSFGKNKINIAISEIVEDSIFGHSVCAGNFREIRGTYKTGTEGIYEIDMREPGDDKYDGVFSFTVNTHTEELIGTWTPYKNTVKSKIYSLKRKEFVYDPEVGTWPQTSTRYLDIEEVENLLPEEVEMRRNEIYARHGYSFNNVKIRRVFDAKDWYVPVSIDIRSELTSIEAKNIDLLYNYEEYYEEYYNEYGR